ncbi:MAG: efflux RND transporter periplasmic adaptor subunit [Haliscomenobacteraceae bacterium CHB4]|nr:Cation efflux system protein CusB [Saprospiraceae bacterium]MCE7921979.1 efflux RND transporter periplasmic adaptor subunit [Haliscomenobacteraceae bacterium CHB4]
MKKNWNKGKLTVFAWLVFALTVVACRQKNAGHEGHFPQEKTGHEGHAAEEKAVYTCPMHPEILRDAPGSCPICGMDLVKKESDHTVHAAEPDSSDILLKPTYEYVLSATATFHPEQKSFSINIEVPGYLAYDARKVNAVSARYGGRIERLYVRYLFQPVQKGQRLLDIYSPGIVTAQQELIFLKENDPGNATLLENARRRLSLLGMTDKQISDVETSRKPLLSLPVYSSYAGLIVENPGAGPAPTMPGGGMNDDKSTQKTSPSPPSTATSAELSLKEGMYVQPGQRLFGLQSLATVWAILEFYPSAVQSLKVGQAVELHIESLAEPLQGKINYIEPLYASGGKNLRARVYLPNPGNRLKPGTLLTATVQTGNKSALWIPASAAIDLGQNKIAFVKTAEGFRSQKISTGQRSGQMLEVTAGLSPDNEIAENAQLLMDSESFVKTQ